MDANREILVRELHLFEAAAERLAAGNLPPGDPLAGDLADELGHRLAIRTNQQEEFRKTLGARERRIWEFLILPVPQPHWGAIPLPGWVWLILVAGLWLLIAPGMLIGGAVVIGLVVAKLGHDAAQRRLYRTLIQPRCIHCEYSMEAAVDGLPAELLGGHTGPRRCPECGLPWPCIPGPNG
jgi:hypothetical protein